MILKVTSRIARWGRLLFLPLFGCSRTLLPVRNFPIKILVTVSILFFSTSKFSFALQLSSDTSVATAGYYQLTWSGKSNVFQLQESITSDFNSFKILYTGQDVARVISGKPNGDYFYRVTNADEKNSKVSETIKVIVSHHSLQHALLFFVAGAIVFIAILFLILKGKRLEN